MNQMEAIEKADALAACRVLTEKLLLAEIGLAQKEADLHAARAAAARAADERDVAYDSRLAAARALRDAAEGLAVRDVAP